MSCAKNSSLAPFLKCPPKSVPWLAKRQVYILPSADKRKRLQVPQKAFVTEEIKPTSPCPSLKRYTSEVSPPCVSPIRCKGYSASMREMISLEGTTWALSQ